jgi:hypothetical protein
MPTPKRSSWVTTTIVVVCCVMPVTAAFAVDEETLDGMETGICRENSGLERAVAGADQMRRESAEAQQQRGRGSEDEQRRAFLQNEFIKRAIGAQDQIVAESRAALQSRQAEYLRRVGRNFDTTQCDGGQLRVSRAARLQEKKEKEWEDTKAMMNKALADGEAYRQAQIACEDWKILQRPAEEIERWRPGYQAEARARYGAFAGEYQRKTGKPFDVTRCH